MLKTIFTGKIWKKTELELKAFNEKITSATTENGNLTIISSEKLTNVEMDAISDFLHSTADDPRDAAFDKKLKDRGLIA